MQRIVVGIDGSKGATTALTWAVEEAMRRDATVEVVYAWHVPYVEGYPYARAQFDPGEFETAAQAVLDETVASLGDVPVVISTVARCGTPSSVLVEAAKGADLLVVGSRGRGGFTGLLLGSVSQQVSHHAPCPVVIVPQTD
ncbi:MAG TPA: universal stress protein [Acidimicrobiales bacterium]|nr:universal stress protein [Acidimicrobiales bacterium]